jgi:hypothetical protein
MVERKDQEMGDALMDLMGGSSRQSRGKGRSKDTTEMPLLNDNTGAPPLNDGTGAPPLDDGTGAPPLDDGTETPPPLNDGTGAPPLDDGTGAPPPLNDGTGAPPLDDGTGAPPLNDGTGAPPPNDDGTETQPLNVGTETPPTTVSINDVEPVALEANRFLVCRVIPGRPGFGFDESALDYQTGEPVYSELQKVEADTTATDITNVVGGVLTGGAALLGPSYKFAAATLGASNGILGVITHNLAKSETSALSASIQNQFRETNRRIDELTDIVKKGFNDVRQDFADNSLDMIMSPLQAIDVAYREMVQSFNDTNPSVRRVYAARYR